METQCMVLLLDKGCMETRCMVLLLDKGCEKNTENSFAYHLPCRVPSKTQNKAKRKKTQQAVELYNPSHVAKLHHLPFTIWH